MNNLVKDFATHPLLPGGLLAAIIGDPQSRKIQPLDYSALFDLNKHSTVEIVGHFQIRGTLREEEASTIISIDNQYVQSFKALMSNLPEVAFVTECNEEA